MFIVQTAKVWGGDSLEPEASVFTTYAKAKMSYDMRRRKIINDFRSLFGDNCVCRFDYNDKRTAGVDAPVTFQEREDKFEIWYRDEMMYHFVMTIIEQIPDTIYV